MQNDTTSIVCSRNNLCQLRTDMHEHYFLSIKQPSISARLIESPFFSGIQWAASMLFNLSSNEKNLSQQTRCYIVVPSSEVFG